jgi:MoaA/NifB/PqqE/SkfB family radical SAM enzyme
MIRYTKIPYAVRILLTNKCNLNCSFCLRDSSDKTPGKELNTEEWLNFFDRLRELRVFRISLSGGEIFLRDDLFLLLRKLRENRMHQIT